MNLKELAGYLPYGVMSRDRSNSIYRLDLSLDTIHLFLNGVFKPILRSISDLTKEIEVNGKKFVPIEVIRGYTDLNHFTYIDRFIYDEETFELLPYWVCELLFKWNFDINGLIEKGEAIDMNTL